MEARHRYQQVAQLHVRCLDRGFLATLGQGFLELMYEAIDAAPGAMLLTAERNGRVAGFITGGTGMRPIYAQMLRSPFRLARSMLPSLLSVSRIRRILEIVRYSGGSALPLDLPDGELLSLAVGEEWRGKGVAEELYQQLVRRFYQSGVAEFRIIVGESLQPAHRFYRRMGAVPVAEIQVHTGEASTVYVHTVTSSFDTTHCVES